MKVNTDLPNLDSQDDKTSMSQFSIGTSAVSLRLDMGHNGINTGASQANAEEEENSSDNIENELDSIEPGH